MLSQNLKAVSYTHLTNIRYLAEATLDTADYINGLLRMHAVDEIILYTVPVSYTHLDVYKRQIFLYN